MQLLLSTQSVAAPGGKNCGCCSGTSVRCAHRQAWAIHSPALQHTHTVTRVPYSSIIEPPPQPENRSSTHSTTHRPASPPSNPASQLAQAWQISPSRAAQGPNTHMHTRRDLDGAWCPGIAPTLSAMQASGWSLRFATAPEAAACIHCAPKQTSTTERARSIHCK